MGKPTYGEFSFPSDFGFAGSAGKTMVKGYSRGGKSKTEKEVAAVMKEFGRGELHSGSKKGPVVTNPKQAVAIGYSEAKQAAKKKPVKAQTGGEIRQGSQAPITPEERMKMEQMARQQANLRREAVTKPDRSRAEERSFERLRERSGDTMSEEERMREKYSEKPIRRKDGGSAHSDEAMDKKVVAAVLKKHADQPASKAHKGLKFGGKAVPSYKSTPKIK
jgi:hypothetical protein